MKERACQQTSFTDWFWKVSSPNGLSVLLPRRKKGKIMLLVCLLSAVWPALSTAGKIIEDEAIYNFWRFLAEDFFLPVIKQPWQLVIHSCVIFVIFSISRRDGDNNGFLASVPLLPPPSRVVSRPNSLSLPFRAPATQANWYSKCFDSSAFITFRKK